MFGGVTTTTSDRWARSRSPHMAVDARSIMVDFEFGSLRRPLASVTPFHGAAWFAPAPHRRSRPHAAQSWSQLRPLSLLTSRELWWDELARTELVRIRLPFERPTSYTTVNAGTLFSSQVLPTRILQNLKHPDHELIPEGTFFGGDASTVRSRLVQGRTPRTKKKSTGSDLSRNV